MDVIGQSTQVDTPLASRIRLAHVVPFFGVGGTEQLVLDLCRFSDSSRFDCLVAATGEGPIWKEIRAAGVPVITGRQALRAAAAWADLVNIHWPRYAPEWHRIVLSAGKRYVTTLHWPSSLPRIEAITVCTGRAVYEIQQHKDRCVVIPNGVDLERFATRGRSQSSLNPGRGSVTITRICRPERCALYFWDAMERVLRLYPQARLWIVGNEGGPESRRGRVEFLGVRRDVPQILRQTDLFVYTPYPGEGTNDLSVKEALSAGVPCIVSDVESVRESVIDGQNGYRAPFGEVELLARQVGTLIEDETARRRLAENARRTAVERFDIRRTVQLYEAVYEEVMRSG